MRKLLCLIFCLLSLSAFAQTRASFLDLKDVPSWLSVSEPQVKSVLQFGVTGDGSDEYAELKAAFESGGIITIPGSMTITIDAPAAYAGMTITKDTWIIGNGAKIVQKTPTMGTPYGMVFLQAATNNLNIRIDNLFVDGADTARIGIAVVLDVANSGGILGIHGCKSENMAGGLVDLSTSGIVAYGMFDTITIDGCVVDDIARTASGTPSVVSATGISVTEALGVTTIRNCKVTDITSNAASSWIDADAIVVASHNQTTNPDILHQVTITNNFIQNFSGRAVKSQCPNPQITNNTFRHDTGAVMVNGTFVDLQIGGGVVAHNKFIITTAGGASQAFVQCQSNIARYPEFSIHNNTFIVSPDVVGGIPYGVITNTAAGANQTNIRVFDNAFVGNIIRCVAPEYNLLSAKTFISVTNNTLSRQSETTYLIYPTGTAFATAASSSLVIFDVRGNNAVDTTTNSKVVYDSVATYPMSIFRLAANSGFGDVGFNTYFPFLANILPGSSFLYTGTTLRSIDGASGTLHAIQGTHSGANGPVWIERGEKTVRLTDLASSTTIVGTLTGVGTTSWRFSDIYP